MLQEKSEKRTDFNRPFVLLRDLLSNAFLFCILSIFTEKRKQKTKIVLFTLHYKCGARLFFVLLF